MNVDPEKLPWIVSYPRCGRHWVKVVLELYFRRPSSIGTRSPLTPREQARPPLYYHHHDPLANTKLPEHGNLAYIYRDPVDVLYSNLRYLNWDEPFEVEEDVLNLTAGQYRKHLDRYLRNGATKVSLQYDDMKADPVLLFGILVQWLGDDLRGKELTSVCERVTPEFIATQGFGGMDKSMLTAAYGEGREQFREDYGAKIYEQFAPYFFER